MGLRPADFYSMEWEDFWLMQKGWNDRLQYEASLLRLQTAYIVGSMGGAKAVKSVMEGWEIGGVKKEQSGEITPAMKKQLQRFREQEALKKANAKRS